jgi:heme/copper-type cytochrome/quinol oxidase subunit 4
MPVPQPHTYSLVPYETPAARASHAAGTAATGFLIALGLAVIPILIAFLQAGAFNRTALIAMATAVGVAALSVLFTFLVKLQQAKGSDIPPTVTPAPPTV